MALPSAMTMPTLGLGTWGMGERKRERRREIQAIQAGIELGMTLVDTAEMYGEGGAEEVVGEAIAGRRSDVFVVTKVYPQNASHRGVIDACARSLRRMKIDCVDLYLLHWRGAIPLAQTVAGFEQLRAEGRIRAWGVSNFDSDDMEQLFAIADGKRCAANQVLYHLGCRGIEWDLLPWCRQRGVAVMAYSPLGQKALLANRPLISAAETLGVTPSQLALAWLLERGVAVIPKASDIRHVHDNSACTSVVIPAAICAALDAAFPAPARATPLAML
jgi:diketogulonate reductase-like aldo/keto reductase